MWQISRFGLVSLQRLTSPSRHMFQRCSGPSSIALLAAGGAGAHRMPPRAR
ncbi:hypothetical protein OEM_p101100 (plasmid) [Mycobacterium intracellulare subsp. yongonense 05-1390]|nr:hypothetical protein OEM_p101100 [Mycobacterium intracellulare subsp. yongonense 05-1390]